MKENQPKKSSFSFLRRRQTPSGADIEV